MAAALAVALALGMALVSCSASASVESVSADEAVADAVNGAAECVYAPEADSLSGSEPTIDAEADAEEAKAAEQDVTAQERDAIEGPANPATTSSARNQDIESTGCSNANSSAPAQSTPQKKWVEYTEHVWVVDKEAWTESVPVYSTIEVSICNICGQDVTGNTAAHAKAHMKAGEGSGHHSEVRRGITEYNSVNHKEERHWETKVVGGHWE